ncbi:MAG TPA: hypothetical protein PLE19_14190 [Planctomycetota bacterium]|nr:hypothetical protein [Planctomycetota bacterium]HRR81454.1 hypothetical protein [Planctomycetota bacterium]HRT94956.1 hypothetical protein [Planctomycetota bacterium]
MSELHLRGILTSLALLDETLCAFERWASGSEDHGVLYHERNPLLPREREAIRSLAGQIREELGEIRARLGLEPKVQDLASNIWGWCCTLMEPLQELEGRYLRRYGEPPAELVRYMDPKVARLCELLGAIQRVASAARNRPTTPDYPRTGAGASAGGAALHRAARDEDTAPTDGAHPRVRTKGTKKG